MTTQRRFEGNTLAEVLAKVQQEVGSDAKIASAQKVRSGGAFGFFQRERFEVIVDIPEPKQEQVIEEEDDFNPASLLELAQSINEEERDKERTVSTETDAFAEVLSRMAFQADLRSEPEPEPAAPQPTIPDRPAFLDEPKEPVQPNPNPAPEPTPIDPKPEPLPVPTPIPEPVPTPVPVPENRTRITDHPLAQLGLPGQLIPREPEVIDLRAHLTETLEANLPKIPVIRPSRGSIIAVVGSRDDATRLAADLAREFGRPKEEIVVASQHAKGTPADNVLKTVESAEDAQRSWSRRRRPTFVAIEAHPGSRDTSWAEHVLTALEPIATFGVLDATRKSEDIAAWADALGGIDCLAVNNVEETVSPASVLQAGIPVERIDGRKATPEYWALLLTERLTAA